MFFLIDNCNDESTIQIDQWGGPLTDDTYEVFVRYCTEGSWHYLCSGGVGWARTLAAVACRQQGYSDQGEKIIIHFLITNYHNYHLQKQCVVFWAHAMRKREYS